MDAAVFFANMKLEPLRLVRDCSLFDFDWNQTLVARKKCLWDHSTDVIEAVDDRYHDVLYWTHPAHCFEDELLIFW